MSHNNQRAHSSTSTSTPSTSTSTATASTSPPKTFSEVVADVISAYEVKLSIIAPIIVPYRNRGIYQPQYSSTFLLIYERLEIVLSAEWFKKEDERLQKRGRALISESLDLHRIVDPRSANDAMEKYHLRQFLD